MSPELRNAIAATNDDAAWQAAAADPQARQEILAAALTAAGVQRSDMPAPPPAPPALRVTITFPPDADAKAVGKVLDAGRCAGAVLGQVCADDAPGFALTETYQNGEVVR